MAHLLTLLPPPTGIFYDELDELLEALQEHAKGEGYAISSRRSKKGRNGVLCKVSLCCARGTGGNKAYKDKGNGIRHESSTIKYNCPFAGYAVNYQHSPSWQFILKEARHTHWPSLPTGLRIHRTEAMTAEIREMIEEVGEGGCKTSHIYTMLRRAAQKRGEEMIITRRDIQNVKASLRQDGLGHRTATEKLLEDLERDNWTYIHVVDTESRITHLFFMHKGTLGLLKRFWEVFLIDSTYKTNKYGLPLSCIGGSNNLHGTFFIGYAFLLNETQADFEWLLEVIRRCLIDNDIPSPKI